jgi:hypothetical protein
METIYRWLGFSNAQPQTIIANSNNTGSRSQESNKVILHTNALEEIFGWLNVEDRTSCARTCKNWRMIVRVINAKHAHDPQWKSIQICERLLQRLPLFKQQRAQMQIIIRNNTAWVVLKSTAIMGAVTGVSKLAFYLGKQNIEALKNMSPEERADLATKISQARASDEWDDSLGSMYGGAKNVEEYIAAREGNYYFMRNITIGAEIVLAGCLIKYTNSKIQDIKAEAVKEEPARIAKALSYPEFFSQDRVLSNYACQISQKVPLLPVKVPASF